MTDKRQEQPKKRVAIPKGWRLDPLADARLGKSLFQMQPEDWLVRHE